MELIFWITTGACIACWVARLLNRDYFSILTYVVLGIYLPMFLYFAGWSYLFTSSIQIDFYYIFICFNLALLFVQPFDPVMNRTTTYQFVLCCSSKLVIVVNCIYIAAMLAENYLGSGYFLPALHGIDIHTYHAPVLFWVTGATYIVMAIDTLSGLFHQKRFLLLDLVIIALLFVGKSARMDVFISIIQTVSLLIFANISKVKKDKSGSRIKASKLKKKILSAVLACALIAIVLFAVNVGNTRMNHYGQYDIQYSDGIGYKGPEFFGDAMAYYYGYFPFSFYNLNVNIALVGPHENYIGQDSFRSLYFGILQFDNVFDMPLNEANDSKIIVTKGATVTTGFWDFYYDYGQYCYIPMIISMVLYILLRRNLFNNSFQKSSSILSYFYWTPLWFFMSFNNTVWDTCVLVNLILLLLISDKVFKVTVYSAGK